MTVTTSWDRVGVGVPRGSFRPSGVFLGTLALTAVGGVMAWQKYGSVQFDVFLFVIFGWIASLSLHEYAHALFAYRGGDRTVASRGYLKLNPLKYAHPVLSIVLPVLFLLLGGIGLPGGAVWVDHSDRATRRPEPDQPGRPADQPRTRASLLSLPFVSGRPPWPHRLLGRRGVPGVSAAHRGDSEPDPAARPGRRQRGPALADRALRPLLRPVAPGTACCSCSRFCSSSRSASVIFFDAVNALGAG